MTGQNDRLVEKSDRFARHRELWRKKCPVVAMIHLPPLPGSPRFTGSMGEILAQASSDAALLAEGGVDGILVENYGDAPFFPGAVPPETVAAMALAVRAVVEEVPVPVGVNVLRNDAAAALAVAATAGARFIRVNVHTGSMNTDQGTLVGQAHATLRLRTTLGPEIALLADVLVKHATPPHGLTLESAARDTWDRGLADGLILTGTETGEPVEVEAITTLRGTLPAEAKIWVGSGATAATLRALAQAADGIIVGSALQMGGMAGKGLDPTRIRAFRRGLA